MRHYDEDALLKQVLGLLDLEKKQQLEAHLDECEECRLKYHALQGQVGTLGSVRVERKWEAPPLPKVKFVSLKPLLRAAAILILGFAIGYLTSELSRTSTVHVVPQQFAYQAAQPPGGSAVHCEVVDISP